MTTDLRRTIERTFDPTDADSAQQLAYKALALMQVCARAMWANEHNLRMGRDDSEDMSVLLQEVAQVLGLPVSTGAEFAELLHGCADDH